ncbi:MAG: TetR/AcrR family transcriptional regulator [Deltaproteobacteria bacterium]|nr:TetR/AcrR family transcriptional regulator [Deltaproteobacteria bacterium]MBW2385793.1 TetR/AcrR family transcriptional regulator [Deltaproteobacteria bacterium]MBW2695816.1 TetR/AcrR family transcriptional regulator [Deltaproteobacteria bacterium]
MTDSPRRIQLPIPAARPRSHAERSAETRAAILKAVSESVVEVGFTRTTAAEIARRAHVTWGAVQHHFGGKDGMLTAVLEDSFNRFVERVESVPREGRFEKRVSLFIDRAWDHYSSADYRTANEILLHFHAREDVAEAPAWSAIMSKAWNEIWCEIFDKAPVSRQRQVLLARYTLATLSGLAGLLVISGDPADSLAQDLEILKHQLIGEFRGEER